MVALLSEINNRLLRFNPWIVKPDAYQKYISPFLPEKYIPRQLDRVKISSKQALVIIGPRQSGKSTIAWHLLKPFFPNLLFFNMEDPLLKTGCVSAIEMISLIRSDFPFIKAIFIDEIQHLEEAGLFVKMMVDARFNLPIIVTGSSSFHLRSKTRESLAGRAIRRMLLPFSLQELLDDIQPSNDLAMKEVCNEIVGHQLIIGSYPSVYLEKKIEDKKIILSDLVEALILRDASDIFKIKRIDAFRKLMTLLAGQIGNLINVSELAAHCNVNVGSVNAYNEIMEESHIIKRLRPFVGGKRHEITGAPKIFFIDNGIRNQLLNSFSTNIDLRTDRGPLFENWLFSEIYKALPFQATIKYWRSKSGAEVDFIIEFANQLIGIEAKASKLTKTRLSKSATSFVKAYKPLKLAIVNLSLDMQAEYGGTQIDFITPPGLLKWLDSIHTLSG